MSEIMDRRQIFTDTLISALSIYGVTELSPERSRWEEGIASALRYARQTSPNLAPQENMRVGEIVNSPLLETWGERLKLTLTPHASRIYLESLQKELGIEIERNQSYLTGLASSFVDSFNRTV
jgi:hypothetical protein